MIRAYNEERHIGRLLERIRQQTLKDKEKGSTTDSI
jgi:glycosyltransferase involved in cell wall biosynthesis